MFETFTQKVVINVAIKCDRPHSDNGAGAFRQNVSL